MCWANYFAHRWRSGRCRATNFAHRTQKHGDIETNNTTARPQQGTAETDVTSAPKNCTKNAHFSPAKAMAVSIPRRHKRAKAVTVSVEAQPARAKATGVSHHRATSPAAPRRDTHGRRRHRRPQISHAIRLEEVSTMSENVAIPTLLIHDSKESRGNCMRNWGSSAMMWILINTTRPTGVEGAGGTAGPGCGARGRWRGLAGLRDDAPSEARGADGSRAGRRPPAHTAAGPSGARNTREATSNTSGATSNRQPPQAQQSGPEPLGSGPPSMLSGDQRTTRVSSARPPCHPCQSSRR